MMLLKINIGDDVSDVIDGVDNVHDDNDVKDLYLNLF